MSFEDFEEEYDRLIQTMLDDGSLLSIEGTGEDAIMTFNLELLEVLHPNVYEMVREEQLAMVEEALSSMVDKGLLEMSFKEDENGELEAVYSIGADGYKMVETIMDDLT